MKLGVVIRYINYTKYLFFKTSDWDRISNTLRNELHQNLGKFIKQLSDVEDFKSSHNHSTYTDFKIGFSNITIDSFMAQKYTANKGRYVYHNDSLVEWEVKRKRFMTYLWYLNDVTEGGETEFDGKYQIKPTSGKLILFPASWTFPHCGKMPISSDKYIITGWIYTTEHS
jgi:Rps23 Pro-64 3,4-dihydroxylase Tpa1-like proline 4-hydroxylase